MAIIMGFVTPRGFFPSSDWLWRGSGAAFREGSKGSRKIRAGGDTTWALFLITQYQSGILERASVHLLEHVDCFQASLFQHQLFPLGLLVVPGKHRILKWGSLRTLSDSETGAEQMPGPSNQIKQQVTSKPRGEIPSRRNHEARLEAGAQQKKRPFLPGSWKTTNRSREYDGNQRRSVYFHRTASSGWDRTCWSICFNLWSRCACLSDTTDSKVKYNKIKGKQMQVHANPKCCTAEFRRGSGRSPVLSLDAINADRQVLRACSENW